MDAIVPPNNTSLVTGNDSHNDQSAWNLSTQLLDTANALNQNIDRAGNDAEATAQRIGLAADATAQRLGLAGVASTERNGSEGRLVTNENAVDGRNITNQNGLEGRGVTERNGSEGRKVTQEFGFANLNETRHEGSETRDDLEKFGFHNASRTEFYGHENFKAQKDSLKDILLQACGNTDRIVCNDNANAKEIVLQAERHTAAIQSKLCSLELQQARDFGAIQLEAAKNTAKIELDAARHTAQLAKEIASCCCANEKLALENRAHTEALIRKLDEDRVRDQRDALREELIAVKLRSTLTPAPVAAVTL